MDYRESLRDELARRKMLNPRYTLRSYARSLNLDSGSLSAILKGRRKLPKTHWALMVEQLRLRGRRRTLCLQSLDREHGLQLRSASPRPRHKAHLDEKLHWRITTEWEHFATLCLMDCPRFRLSEIALAKALHISRLRAHEVIAQLEEAGLIVWRDSRFLRAHADLTTTEDRASKILQRSHANDLELAKKKLEELNHLSREFTSVLLTVRHADLPKMKTWIRQMRDSFENTFESKKGDQVMQMSIQLFPLSERIEA